MISFNIAKDIRTVERALKGLERKAIPISSVQAINRTIKTVRTHTARALNKETGMKITAIKRRLTIATATRRLLRGVMSAGKWTPNVGSFPTRQGKKGVWSKAWGRWQEHPGSFYVNNKRTVLKRKGKKRLPLKRVYGPVLQNEFLQRIIVNVMEGIANTRWPIEFERAINNQIRRFNKKSGSTKALTFRR